MPPIVPPHPWLRRAGKPIRRASACRTGLGWSRGLRGEGRFLIGDEQDREPERFEGVAADLEQGGDRLNGDDPAFARFDIGCDRQVEAVRDHVQVQLRNEHGKLGPVFVHVFALDADEPDRAPFAVVRGQFPELVARLLPVRREVCTDLNVDFLIAPVGLQSGLEAVPGVERSGVLRNGTHAMREELRRRFRQLITRAAREQGGDHRRAQTRQANNPSPIHVVQNAAPP